MLMEKRKYAPPYSAPNRKSRSLTSSGRTIESIFLKEIPYREHTIPKWNGFSVHELCRVAGLKWKKQRSIWYEYVTGIRWSLGICVPHFFCSRDAWCLRCRATYLFFFVVLWIIYYHDCIFLDVKQLSGQIILKGGIRFVKIFFCATHFRFPADRLFSRGLAFFLVGSRESLLAGFIRYLKNSFYFTTGKTPSHNSEEVVWNGYQTLHLL